LPLGEALRSVNPTARDLPRPKRQRPLQESVALSTLHGRLFPSEGRLRYGAHQPRPGRLASWLEATAGQNEFHESRLRDL
jgi:hypothetical protein